MNNRSRSRSTSTASSKKRWHSETTDNDGNLQSEIGSIRPKPAKRRRQGSGPALDPASNESTSGDLRTYDGPTTPPETLYSGLTPVTNPTPTPSPHCTLQELTQDLGIALQRDWSDRHQTRFSKYHTVKSFLVSWEEDDLGVETEVDDLARLFEHTYSYKVEKWKIPPRRPQIALDKKVADLVEEMQDPSTLLIFYYAGHARPSRQYGSYPVWQSCKKGKAKEVIPLSTQRYLEDADFDVLFLFDCCHPIHSQSGLETRGIKEVLAAGGFETVAAEVGDHSFSRFLIDQLAQASTEHVSVSATELHGRMLTSLANYAPTLIRDHVGRIALDANNRPRFEQSRRCTPVHYFISPKHESIILAPLRPDTVADTTSQPPMEKGDAPQPGHDIGEGIVAIAPRKQHPQVILSVRLDSSETLNASDWVNWLKKAPPEAKEIKVEGWFGSFSTLVLLNVPLGIWHMMPHNPAVSFVEYVTTQNLAPSLNLLARQTNLQEITPSHELRQRFREPPYSPVLQPHEELVGRGQMAVPDAFDPRQPNPHFITRDSGIDVNYYSASEVSTSSTRTSQWNADDPGVLSSAQSSRRTETRPIRHRIPVANGQIAEPRAVLDSSKRVYHHNPRFREKNRGCSPVNEETCFAPITRTAAQRMDPAVSRSNPKFRKEG